MKRAGAALSDQNISIFKFISDAISSLSSGFPYDLHGGSESLIEMPRSFVADQ